jgi:hypothetical protein
VRPEGRIVGTVVEVLLAMVGPMVVFGLFSLLAVRYGAETRPYFDERPVIDERPNWFPIPGARPDEADEDEDDDEPQDGEPLAVPEAAPAPVRRQPFSRPLASPSSAATSPSGV